VTAAPEQTLVRRAARAALDKKALGLVVLDVQGVSGIADYFLLCSGRSTTHVQTIAAAIREQLKDGGVRPRHTEGIPESGWVLLDYGTVIVHVFLEDTRAYYALERLWGDAPSLALGDERASGA
jgi:ribosome-associated protein